eukprot:6276012-Amphidinium_carterae.1
MGTSHKAARSSRVFSAGYVGVDRANNQRAPGTGSLVAGQSDPWVEVLEPFKPFQRFVPPEKRTQVSLPGQSRGDGQLSTGLNE